MINYFEKARELGRLVTESEASLRLADAKAAFEANAEAVNAINDYKALQEEISQYMENGEQEKYEEAAKRLASMGTEIKKNTAVAELIKTENDFNFFVNQIIGVLKATITGMPEDDEGCDGGCGGCNGCGGH